MYFNWNLNLQEVENYKAIPQNSGCDGLQEVVFHMRFLTTVEAET